MRSRRSCWIAQMGLWVAAAIVAEPAHAWGDEGHMIVGEVAMHYLQPAVRAKVLAMLAADTTPLTAHDFLSETTWADKFRDSDRNTTKIHYLATEQWHFVDIEVMAPDIDTACFNHPVMPVGDDASAGPAADCSVDKINEFAAELASPATPSAERLLALKFLMHFIGDLHQPLHSSDEDDRGGNDKRVSAAKLGSGTLHGFWDTQLVERVGPDAITVGDDLAAKITPAQVATWSKGTPTDWAMESFAIAKKSVYGKLPKPSAKTGVYALTKTYVNASGPIISTQLSRAGVRLATMTNAALP